MSLYDSVSHISPRVTIRKQYIHDWKSVESFTTGILGQHAPIVILWRFEGTHSHNWVHNFTYVWCPKFWPLGYTCSPEPAGGGFMLHESHVVRCAILLAIATCWCGSNGPANLRLQYTCSRDSCWLCGSELDFSPHYATQGHPSPAVHEQARPRNWRMCRWIMMYCRLKASCFRTH